MRNENAKILLKLAIEEHAKENVDAVMAKRIAQFMVSDEEFLGVFRRQMKDTHTYIQTVDKLEMPKLAGE